MDQLDRTLLNLLKHDARLPIASLAAAAEVSRATARVRIEKLVEQGIISRFTVELGPEARGAAIRAIVHIEVHGTQTDRVTKALMALPDIAAAHSTNGRWDLVAQLESSDLKAFDDTLRKIRLIDGITKTESSLLLSSHYPSRSSI